MTSRNFKYSQEEHARLGGEMYESKVRPLVEEGNKGKIVAIDIENGDYEVDGDTLAASHRLIERNPHAQIWCVRIGHVAVHSLPWRRMTSGREEQI